MPKKIFVYAHPDDEATSITAIKRSAETPDGTRLVCISNGDSNVEHNSSVRELETAEALSAYMGRAPSEVNGMIDFCSFSEAEFREALLNEQFEQILEETVQIREKIGKLTTDSNIQLFTNFPDGGDARHLYVTWVVMNVIFPYLVSKGIPTEIFGNPKQIFDKNGGLLTIGRLPKEWEARLPFAEPANIPEIGLENGVLTLTARERKWLELLFKNPEHYASQRNNGQNRDLFNLYMNAGLHHEEHFYKLDSSQLDYEKLPEQLPVVGLEAFGKKQVKNGRHGQVITYDHFLKMKQELEAQL